MKDKKDLTLIDVQNRYIPLDNILVEAKDVSKDYGYVTIKLPKAIMDDILSTTTTGKPLENYDYMTFSYRDKKVK